ncbi:hypothetical protein [Pedobacter sp.]|uniref:hypothetical protein n=1 Tax=Pedobacter sp. TaxID=1411316 RepID=UPI003D7F3BED
MMNQEDLFKKIGHIISELQEQYQYIAEHPQNLNELEIELLLSNANFLTDHIQIVRKTLNHQEIKAIPLHQETTHVQAPEENDVQVIASVTPVENKFEFEEKQVDQLFNRPLTTEEQEIIAKKQQLNAVKPLPELSEAEVKPQEPLVISVIAPEPQPEPIPAPEPESEIAAPVVELIPEEPVVETLIPEPVVKPTLNEMLANKSGDRAEHPGSEIKDLKQAISLNDKLLFVKDLFHGYNLAYAEVIDLLNKMPDFKSADAFLQHNYAVKNDWSSKQATVDRFYQLLRRRFPAK